eukprot:SAG31_NODE_47836_length_213_cov_56.201754_1_plen_35_part_10
MPVLLVLYDSDTVYSRYLRDTGTPYQIFQRAVSCG